MIKQTEVKTELSGHGDFSKGFQIKTYADSSFEFEVQKNQVNYTFHSENLKPDKIKLLRAIQRTSEQISMLKLIGVYHLRRVD